MSKVTHYEWAENHRKLELAHADLVAAQAETSEENLKSQYVKRGGRVVEKEGADEAAGEEDISKLKLPALKALALELGLSDEGTKAELVEAIKAHKEAAGE